jgi:hypothetical protein
MVREPSHTTAAFAFTLNAVAKIIETIVALNIVPPLDDEASPLRGC